MDRKELMDMFNKRPRIGTLSTSDGKGAVNVAVFGSPHMIDGNTVVMGIGDNRSYKNLKKNPKAAFIVMEPGQTPAEWKGIRVYLEAVAVESEGGLFDKIKGETANRAGKAAADMLKAAIKFTITEVRPLIDKKS
ncbi:MAG: pyridoxamine 5'-phosphate oxidase family protein [Deltaproteobacteria bacterium]|nr:pyridoxamine 5'-phosphate oxidase family protein [Deltaproteobacteria bacterium]